MKKLDHKWAGPFAVTKVISPAAIKLHLSAWEKNIHPVVSVSIICPHIPDEIVECPQPLQPGPIMVDDQEEYEVEEILDSRFRWGKLWYLVKFVGWSHSDNMWLPHTDVVGGIATCILKCSNFANLYLKNMNKTGTSGWTSEGRGFMLSSNKELLWTFMRGQCNLFEDNLFRIDRDPAQLWSFWG